MPAAPPHLGPAVPQHRGRLLRAIGHATLRLFGWRLTGTIPDLPRFVVIVAPHTSNWDFPVGLATKWALGFDVTWLGKDALFRPPLGWFMRAIGGLPVNRASANALVDRTAQEFARRERMVLVLAPEGTRTKVDKWRSGFWHIARTADVPVVCAAIDWGRKQVRFGPTLTVRPDDGAEVDIARIKAHYDDTLGYHPSLQA
jgi:1-acyl-sn-glycerol-3-phosphate acyltransferase